MIEIKNVTFHYAGLEQAGLSDINLTVPAGECVLLCGASGCGKTTITRLINGLIPHYYKGELTGEVKVNGKEIGQQEMYSLAGLVGSVFQNPRSQFFSVDTDGEITFGLENIGLPKEEILARKENVLNDLNLRDLMNRSLFDLSGGEKQKIACGSVAALFPEIIILDEPSSNLDWDSIRDLSEMMKIWKQQGKTIIISEHRLWYLKDIIDRAVYLEKGRIIREWNRETFCLLTEEELASYELRPIHLEEKYIREFSDNKERIQAETTGAGNLAVAPRFLFHLYPQKISAVQEKNYSGGRGNLQSAHSLSCGEKRRNYRSYREKRFRKVHLSSLSLWSGENLYRHSDNGR